MPAPTVALARRCACGRVARVASAGPAWPDLAAAPDFVFAGRPPPAAPDRDLGEGGVASVASQSAPVLSLRAGSPGVRVRTAPVGDVGDVLTPDPRSPLPGGRPWLERHFRTEKGSSHVFAITARDGSRRYAFCRSLDGVHALVLVLADAWAALALDALEHGARVFEGVVRGGTLLGARPAPQPAEGAFGDDHEAACCGKRDDFVVAAVARRVLRCLVDRVGDSDVDGLLRSALADVKGYGGVPNAPERWGNALLERSSPTTTSGASEESRDTAALEDNCAEPVSRKRAMKPSVADDALPWLVAARSPDVPKSFVPRVHELADAAVLLCHFPARAIMSVVAALMEERRVCIVGASIPMVTRVVLAFDSLMRPFAWPHLLSPILVEAMLPVLGAPFPFLVGISSDQLDNAYQLPLDEVVFANIDTGKIDSIGDLGDIFRRIPRRPRLRLERRLTRIRSLVCRRHLPSAGAHGLHVPLAPWPSPPVTTSTLTHATFIAGVGNFPEPVAIIEAAPDDRSWLSSSLRRSSPSLGADMRRRAAEVGAWIDVETVQTIDRAMRKFFAEVLAELPGITTSSATGQSAQGSVEAPMSAMPAVGGNGNVGTAGVGGAPALASFTFTTKREVERRQFVRQFTETQMYMQWKDYPSADPTFGVVQPDGSRLRKRSSIRGAASRVRRAAAADEANATAASAAAAEQLLQSATADWPRSNYDDCKPAELSTRKSAKTLFNSRSAVRALRFRASDGMLDRDMPAPATHALQRAIDGDSMATSGTTATTVGSIMTSSTVENSPLSTGTCSPQAVDPIEQLDSDGEGAVQDREVARVARRSWLSLRFPTGLRASVSTSRLETRLPATPKPSEDAGAPYVGRSLFVDTTEAEYETEAESEIEMDIDGDDFEDSSVYPQKPDGAEHWTYWKRGRFRTRSVSEFLAQES